MACNCGKTKRYVVTTASGRTETVDSLTAAIAIIRKEGGRYQPIKV